ncbi:cytoplasmic protein NCK2-like [Galendromus occidentalis]|uniref:Cytoplasmic protein NCK2-like n=1 Tax=Galendromus occidentalis TaxID=34638 RepID=A0AAJ7L8A8_9ACAR|nr:cytoplasmic protein NCK2-like [Galendromus occidentalis]
MKNFYSHDFQATKSDEISLRKGQLIAVYEKSADLWWYGVESRNEGWFPSNHVHAIEESRSENPSASSAGSDQPIPPSVPCSTPYLSLVGPLGSKRGSEVAAMDKYSSPTHGSQHTVVTLHSFQARNSEELSFSKGERLTILSEPSDDPNWWSAKNVMGQEGLVPRNFIQLELSQSSSDANLDYTGQAWYYGYISRAYAEVLLNAFGSIGDFLIRLSESSSGDLALSVRAPGRNHHFKIQVQGDTFRIGFRKFFSVTDLVAYFHRSPIYTSSEGYRLFLVKAARRPGA